MANVRVRAMVCFAMLFMAMFVSSLAVAKDSNVKQLPQGLDSRHGNLPASLEGKDFRLHRTHAMDASGRVIDDVPAWLVDVRDAYPGNDKFDPMYDTKIPAFEGAGPSPTRYAGRLRCTIFTDGRSCRRIGKFDMLLFL